MAKASGPDLGRLVATINARYYPVEGIADSYCLDGKSQINGTSFRQYDT